MVQRFVNEARALSIVGHPGLVGIYEVGQLESGAPYICMEFLDGETLLNRLERVGNLGSAAFRIGRQVASALAAVHAKGIIHRGCMRWNFPTEKPRSADCWERPGNG